MRPEGHELALTAIVTDLIGTRDAATYFAKKISGVWQRYDLRGDHPLIGRSAPDVEFEDGSRLGEYCRDGDAMLFDFAEDHGVCELGGRWGNRVKVVTIKPKESSDLSALFVRPDGCVAWASDGTPVLDDVAAALSEWLGERS